MQLILQTTSGSRPGRRIHLRVGQVGRVGRTDWADFSFPDDPKMAEVHFAVRCDARSCSLRKLAADAPLSVNGQEVDEVRLAHGDQITAGETTFVVAIEGAMDGELAPDQAGAGEPADAAQTPLDLTALCKYLELDEAAVAMAPECTSIDDLIQRLADSGNYAPAVRLRAHQLAAPDAVQWACACVREVYGEQLPPREAAALEACEQWLADPQDQTRRAAYAVAAENEYQGPGNQIALAVFCSGDSLAPEGFDAVPPDPRACGNSLAIALQLAAYENDPSLAPKRFRHFLKLDAPAPART